MVIKPLVVMMVNTAEKRSKSEPTAEIAASTGCAGFPCRVVILRQYWQNYVDFKLVLNTTNSGGDCEDDSKKGRRNQQWWTGGRAHRYGGSRVSSGDLREDSRAQPALCSTSSQSIFLVILLHLSECG